MRKNYCFHGVLSLLTVIALFLFPVVPTLTNGTQTPVDPVAPGPFGTPDLGVEMPPEWSAEPITYPPPEAGADLVITLDQHLFPALQPIIKDFADRRGLKISVSEGTCGISIGKLLRRSVDIGGFCCPAGRTDRLPGLRFHTIGIAALALLVHPSNPVDNLSLAEAKNIFAGRIHRWSELKTASGETGPDIPVQPVSRLHCKLRPGHWRLLLDNEDLFGPNVYDVGSIPDMIALVADNPRAIGYEVLWNPARYGRQVKPLSLDGYSPKDPASLLAHDYSLYRTYTITTWEGRAAKPLAAELVDYLLNNTKAIDPAFGIVPAWKLQEAGWKFKGNELIGEPR